MAMTRTDSSPAALDTYLADRRRVVDAALPSYLPDAERCAPRLREAMHYSLAAGGKRLRPVLALAAAESIAGEPAVAQALALPVACALEYVHTYSLIHDDLPAMDNDTLRRGRPTSHVVFGEALAILAGDALLTEAFRICSAEPRFAADVSADALADRRGRATGVLALAAGALGMVGGQVLDLEAERAQVAPVDQAGISDAARARLHAQLRLIHASKTGALIRAAATCGAIMAGGSAAVVTAVDRYASELGLAFQIIDDVLDVEGDATSLGKSAGKDAAAGKLTYPALFGAEGSRRLAAEAAERARAALQDGDLGGRLMELVDFVVSRRS